MDLNTYQKVIYILMDLVYILSLNIFIRGVTDKRPKSELNVIIASALCSFADIIVYFKCSESYSFLISGIVLTLLIISVYTREVVKNVIMSIFWMLYMAITEVIIVYLTSLMSDSDVEKILENNLTYTVIIFLTRFFVLISSLIFYMARKKKRIVEKVPSYWCIVLFAFIGSIYIIEAFYSVWHQYATADESYKLLIVAIILMGINVLIFYLYEEQAKHYAIKAEMAQLKNHIDNQRFFYEKERLLWEQTSKERHDMKNLFIAFRGYINDKNYDVLADAVTQKIGSLDSNRMKINSGDRNIDIILTYKIAAASDKGIKVDVKFDICNGINVLPEDMTVLLGNAMDNAIEAAEKTENPYISVNIKAAMGLCRIQIVNSTAVNVHISRDMRVRTTKIEEGHGWGIKSMKNIVDKYNGEFEIICADREFKLKINMMV